MNGSRIISLSDLFLKHLQFFIILFVKIINAILAVSGILATFSFSGCNKNLTDELPNILRIVSEDNSPFLGCYGDQLAITPNLDRLASEGFLYNHAYANAPVCAPARNTIISGVYTCSDGNRHMRSNYPLASVVHMYTKYLREKGYYCTNNSKEDYNTIKEEGVWDESSNKAHYCNRKKGQPFFHIKNCEQVYFSGLCNETQSIFWNSKPSEELYDTENDPWEVNNLADDPEYFVVLERMRKANMEWILKIKDAGFIPKADMIRRTE